MKSSDTVGVDSRGYDAGKKTNGRKRHIVTDTLDLLVVVLVASAALQERDGGRLVLARHHFRILVRIVKRTDQRPTFEVLTCRWVIERTNSWLMRTRGLARDYEPLPAHAEAMVKSTMIGLMTRRLAPGPGRRPWQPDQRRDTTS